MYYMKVHQGKNNCALDGGYSHYVVLLILYNIFVFMSTFSVYSIGLSKYIYVLGFPGIVDRSLTPLYVARDPSP